MKKTEQKPETYKMIPIVIFSCLLIIIGILLAQAWKQQREERLNREIEQAKASQDNTYTLNFNNLPIISNGVYKLYEIDNDSENLITQFTVKDVRTLTNTANGKELTEVTLRNSDNIKSLRLDLSTGENKTVTFMTAQFDKEKIVFRSTLNLQDDEVTGTYILSTPTTPTSNDEASGIHFFKSENQGQKASLILPALNEKWTYRALLQNKVSQVSYIIGNFQDPSKQDDFYKFSTNENNLKYPGEDFVCIEKLASDNPSNCTALDLNNGNFKIKIFITSTEDKELELLDIFNFDIPKDTKTGENIVMKSVFKEPYIELKVKQ